MLVARREYPHFNAFWNIPKKMHLRFVNQGSFLSTVRRVALSAILTSPLRCFGIEMLNGAGEACDVASTFPSVNGRSLTIAV